NTLLWDVVRVVTRLVGRLAKALELRRIKGFCDRRRSARRRMQAIQRMTTRQRHEQQTATYRVLIGIAEEIVGNARGARKDWQDARQGYVCRHGHRRTPQTDRALLRAGEPCDRSGASPRARWRTGTQRREDLFHF